jgi:D-alanyl-D-alanine-carboxypeptidase/D-alanyl-D-alanine-endopeptidase
VLSVSTVEGILDRHARKHMGVVVGIDAAGEERTVVRGAAAADSIFEIGSITKVFTATVVADMVEEGLVALNDPAQQYLPGVDLAVRGRPITLGDLATHTSGLPRLPKGFLRHWWRHRANPYGAYGFEQLSRDVARTHPHRAPGGRWRYSNLGFGLLGNALVAPAGAESYEELVRERIGRPLGLEETFVEVPAAEAPRFAQGHSRRGRVVPHWDIPSLAGAGALRSTARDMLAFLRLHRDAPRSRLGRAARLTQQPRARRGRASIGLGWIILPLRGRPHTVLFHNGGTGGFRSFAGLVRETQVAVVVLSNSARSVDAIGFRLLEALGRSPHAAVDAAA